MLLDTLLRSILIDVDVDVIFRDGAQCDDPNTSCVGDNAIFPPQGKFA